MGLLYNSKNPFLFHFTALISTAELALNLIWVLCRSSFAACPAQSRSFGSGRVVHCIFFVSWSLLFYGSIGYTKKDAVSVPHAGIRDSILFLVSDL